MRSVRPKLRAPTQAEWVGLVLAVISVGAIAVAATTDRWDAWATNIATESLAVAFAVIVIERIVRGAARERLRPRVQRALGHINVEFARIVTDAALDYAGTHAASYREIPRDAIQLLDQWLDDQDAADMPSAPLPPDGTSFLDELREFARQVDQYDHRDRDVLEPDLIAAIRDVWGALQRSQVWSEQAQRWAELGGEPIVPPELRSLLDGRRNAPRVLVAKTRDLGVVLRRYSPPVLFQVDDHTVRWAEEFRREQMERHAPGLRLRP